jgi:hypothetical protein
LSEQVLVFLLVEPHPLDVFRRAEALVELGAVADVLELGLEIGAALARLGVRDLDRAPEPPLVLDDHPGTDRITVDFHRLEVFRLGCPLEAGGSYHPRRGGATLRQPGAISRRDFGETARHPSPGH